MKASIVDLRYRMNDVLKALERNEDVHILYHGKTKGVLKAASSPSMTKVSEHPFTICGKAKKRLTRRWTVCAAGAIVIFDTDIFIWVQRGNAKAARLIEQEAERMLSVHSYLELLQSAENKQQHEYTKSFLRDFGFITLPLTENVGHRAAIYVEQYALSHGLRAGDAIIAATAAESNQILCSSNAKHFKSIRDLKLKVFRP